MSISSRLLGALLTTSALIGPGLCAPALAQDAAPAEGAPNVDPAGTDAAAADPAATDPAAAQPVEEEVEVSAPGAEIVVTGRRDRNISKASDQVVSVLSAAEVARTGDGNIAGALGRVTGLSIVGSGYVYVRGLGDRYSLALLNGLPLPSPEPLKRVVPLDLFPSSVVSSSLVQKSYSANYPGEFGGGVINLTTRAVPQDAFLSIGGGIAGDTETSGQLGYTYYGSGSDWSGFDNGQRDIPPALAAFFASGERISSGNVDTQAIAGQLVTGRNAVLQRWKHLPPNFNVSLAGGKSFDVGSSELGLIAAFGYSNKWQNRQPRQQSSLSADLSTLESDFLQLNTDQRIVVNGLVGLGLEFGDNKLRWTNLFIRDTIKQARLSLGNRQETDVDFMQQKTAWYERQLLDTQLVGEFKLAPDIKLDLRGTFAKSQREAPFELSLEYVRTNSAADPYGAYFVNRLNNGNGGDAKVSFSDLEEMLWAGGADLTWQLSSTFGATVGGAWSDTHRISSRRDFQFQAPSTFEPGVGLLRPDLLLAPGIINYYDIALIEANEGNPAFDARMEIWAGYGKGNWQITDAISLDAGVRYEKADQRVEPIQVFTVPGASSALTSLNKAYWLPGATLTWQLNPELQLRFSGSKTVARPQFRELIFQFYFDPDTNRQYQGNPLLVDSTLTNAEGRIEWYFARDERLSLAGFYKKIDKPIESFLSGGELITSFANAPRATLWGAEVDVQKFVGLDWLGGKLAERRLVVSGNYTYTQSRLSVKQGDTTTVYGAASGIASDYFRDGAPLTGQSDHIANLQLGFEHPDRLSQQTILLTYASDRVLSRGLRGTPPQPDVIEHPGLRLDLVLREGFKLLGRELEVKAEARNLTARKHIEFQQSGSNRIDTNTYDVGRSFSLSASLKF